MLTVVRREVPKPPVDAAPTDANEGIIGGPTGSDADASAEAGVGTEMDVPTAERGRPTAPGDDDAEQGPTAAAPTAVVDDASAYAAAVKERTKEELSYEEDFVTVRLGPDVASLKYIGTYRYKINPETGTILFDIKEVVKCKKMAFRFDFSVTNEEAPYQLAVEIGRYEEYEVPEMEWKEDRHNPGREIGLSSFVVHQRLVRSMGTSHQVRLLEELIKAEESTDTYFETDCMENGVMRRYLRARFLKMVKAELLIVGEQQEKLRTKQQRDSRAATPMSPLSPARSPLPGARTGASASAPPSALKSPAGISPLKSPAATVSTVAVTPLKSNSALSPFKSPTAGTVSAGRAAAGGGLGSPIGTPAPAQQHTPAPSATKSASKLQLALASPTGKVKAPPKTPPPFASPLKSPAPPFMSPARSLGDVRLEEGSVEGDEEEAEAPALPKAAATEHKLELSQRRFMQRKRTFEMPYVNWAMDLIGRQVMIYRDVDRSWQNNVVKDCVVYWTELGTKADVRHMFQMIDNREKPVGEEYEVDLKKVKRFVVIIAPPKLESEGAYLARKGRDKLQQRLHEIDDEIAARTFDIQRQFYLFQKKEERALEEVRTCACPCPLGTRDMAMARL